MLVLLLIGCGESEGTWEFEVTGDEHVEQGIPADVFLDGCSVTFDTFLVNISDMVLRTDEGRHAGDITEGNGIYDLLQPGPHLVGTVAVPASEYHLVEYRIEPASGAVSVNASAEQTTKMNELGSSIRVAGTIACATEVTFQWTFVPDTYYSCPVDALVVERDEATRTQATIPAAWLFRDSLDPAAAANVRAEAIVAADADANGILTQAEVAVVDMVNLDYDVGDHATLDNLAKYISYLAGTMGHLDGDGRCDTEFEDD